MGRIKHNLAGKYIFWPEKYMLSLFKSRNQQELMYVLLVTIKGFQKWYNLVKKFLIFGITVREGEARIKSLRIHPPGSAPGGTL